MDICLNSDRNSNPCGCKSDAMNAPFLYDLQHMFHLKVNKAMNYPIIDEYKCQDRFLLTIYSALCMTYGMASITKKMIRGKPYYYARECKRVNGKPKIVWQQYLGRPEDIINAMTRGPSQVEAQPKPREAVIVEFGAIAALYDLAKRLRLCEHIDRHVPKQGQGPTVGGYLLVAILNRCVAPCSKSGIGKWFQGTVLRRITSTADNCPVSGFGKTWTGSADRPLNPLNGISPSRWCGISISISSRSCLMGPTSLPSLIPSTNGAVSPNEAIAKKAAKHCELWDWPCWCRPTFTFRSFTASIQEISPMRRPLPA